MIYIEYEVLKNKFYKAQEEYNNILSRKEQLFSMTQPKATDYNKERVNGGKPVNTFEEYVVKKEKEDIDNKLEEVASILKDRKMLLDMKEEDLKNSTNPYDKVYYFRCIKNITPNGIAFKIPCDRATVYRYMREIEREAKRQGYELYSLYARKQNK